MLKINRLTVVLLGVSRYFFTFSRFALGFKIFYRNSLLDFGKVMTSNDFLTPIWRFVRMDSTEFRRIRPEWFWWRLQLSDSPNHSTTLMRNPLTSRGDHVIVQAAFGLHLDSNELNANTRESLTYSNCISAQPSRLTTRKEQADLKGKRFQESCM